MMETGCMANYDGDRLYSNTIMKNIVWRMAVLNCTTETWSACTSTILVVTDLYMYRYDSCGGRLVQVRFLWWPTYTSTILVMVDLYRYDSCGTSTILVVADLYKYDSCVKL